MADAGAVRGKTARAAVWSILSTGGAKLITLISLAVLARILAPAEFGLLAFALAYMTYAETIGDLGSGMALVYWPNRREDAAQVTFVTNLVAGIFWTLLTIVIAPFIADFFNAPDGAPIVRMMGVAFLFKYLGNTHDALAQKDLRFGARALPELGLTTVKAAISIVLGYLGFGAWSLVWGHLAGTFMWTVLLWVVVPWRPGFRLPLDLVRPMLTYGRGIISLNVLSAINHHADLAVVGRFAGVTALGLYQVASKVPEATVIVAIWALSKVLFPAFTRLVAAGKSLDRPYLLAMRYVSAVTLPAGVGLACLSRPVIELAFGEKWISAAPILAALALHASIRALSNPPGDVLKATDKASVLAWLALARAVVTIPALMLAAARFGATGVAVTLTVVALTFTVISAVIVARVIAVPLRKTVAAAAPALGAAAAMAAAVLAWVHFTAPSILEVTGGVGIGALVYVGVLRLLDPTIVRQTFDAFRVRRGGSPAEGVS